MHEFDNAIQHYESAIKMLNDDDLKFEYLELLIKVGYIYVSVINLYFTRTRDVMEVRLNDPCGL